MSYTEFQEGRIAAAKGAKSFWCSRTRQQYDSDKYTPVLIMNDLICLEANDSDVTLWEDGTYHWKLLSGERPFRRPYDWGPNPTVTTPATTTYSSRYKGVEELKKDLQEALENLDTQTGEAQCQPSEEQTA